MTDFAVTSKTFEPKAAMAAFQSGYACWSRACAEMTRGMMAAGLAQFDLSTSLMRTLPGYGTTPRPSVEVMKGRYDHVVADARKIGDALSTGYFAAAGILADGYAALSAAGEGPVSVAGKSAGPMVRTPVAAASSRD